MRKVRYMVVVFELQASGALMACAITFDSRSRCFGAAGKLWTGEWVRWFFCMCLHTTVNRYPVPFAYVLYAST